MESLEILEDQVRSLNHDLSDLTKERTELEKESEKDKNLVKELKGEVSVCIDIQKICIISCDGNVRLATVRCAYTRACILISSQKH